MSPECHLAIIAMKSTACWAKSPLKRQVTDSPQKIGLGPTMRKSGDGMQPRAACRKVKSSNVICSCEPQQTALPTRFVAGARFDPCVAAVDRGEWGKFGSGTMEQVGGGDDLQARKAAESGFARCGSRSSACGACGCRWRECRPAHLRPKGPIARYRRMPRCSHRCRLRPPRSWRARGTARCSWRWKRTADRGRSDRRRRRQCARAGLRGYPIIERVGHAAGLHGRRAPRKPLPPGFVRDLATRFGTASLG